MMRHIQIAILAALVSACAEFTNKPPVPVVVTCETYRQLEMQEKLDIAAALEVMDEQIQKAERTGKIAALRPLVEPLLEWRRHSKGAEVCQQSDKGV
jgi:RNase P/RNase MRP subunit p30